MNSEENRVREICRQARVIASRKQRDAFLSSACGLNRALLSKVETMLAAESVAGTSLKPSAGSDQSHTVVVSHGPTEVREAPGAVIGRYKLLERIGEGGFGTV